MLRRTTTTTALAVLLAVCLAGCASSTTAKPASAPSTAKTSAAPTKAELIQRCADAIAASTSTDQQPAACADLSLDDYYTALTAANQQGRNSLQRQLEQATQSPR